MAVTVQREDGSVLDSYAVYSGLKVKDILELLKEDGYNGVLRMQGSRAFPNAPVTDGETYVFVETKPKEETWFLLHETAPEASSLANSVPDMKRLLGTELPLYDLGRTSNAAPLVLTVEAFSEYAKHLKSHVLSSRDWDFVSKMMKMSDFFDAEEDRRKAFARDLEEYLRASFPGVNFRFLRERARKPNSDVRVEAFILGEWILVTIVEVKPELGLRGEPCVEAVRYFAEYTIAMRNAFHWSYFHSSCPMLIIELVGPNIRVGGAAHYLDKPAHQPFTPYLHILKYLQDSPHMELLFKALSSIPVAISSLVQFYTSLKSQQQQVVGRVPELEWPYPMRELKNGGATVIQQTLKEDLRLMGVGRVRKLVFYVRLPDQRERIIKFCQRYGDEVHRLWGKAGFAPEFSSCVLNDGNWRMIDMKFYSEEDGWRPLSALDPNLFAMEDDRANDYRINPQEWEVCKKKVLEAYEVVHALDPLKVHGDMRRQNILYNVFSTKVAFIDFDWAGTQGRDRYPLLLNELIDWAPGVTACGIMAVNHDRVLLRKELCCSE